jgi:hypothetical protein
VRTVVEPHGVIPLLIQAADPVLQFLREVHSSGSVEIVWHSTWRAAANTDLCPALGLPAFGVSDAPEWDTRDAHAWWKLPAVNRAAESTRPLIWTDDDISGFEAATLRHAALIGRLRERPKTLLISPDRAAGLTPDDLARISHFVAS